MKYQRLPSTTSLSGDDDDDHHEKSAPPFDEVDIHSSIVVAPAQWARPAPPSARLSNRLSPMSHLPSEILIHVLRHLHSPRDLHSCLQVSRTWCECSVELLWHKPTFNKYATLEKMARLLDTPDQTFIYASFIRRLNFLAIAKELKDNIFGILGKCDRLERLTLVNCNLLSSAVLSSTLPCFPHLVAVDLTGVENTSDDAIVGLAHVAKRLQGINLTGCKSVSDKGIMALALNCPLLRRVKLGGLEGLTDKPLCQLARSCPLLLEIELSSCKLITDVSIRDIWTYSTHMREMRLSQCVELTDAAFPSPIRKEHTKVHPEVTPHPFTPHPAADTDELPPLIVHRTFEHLRMLDLTACSRITDDAIDGIISHAPKIRNLVLSKCSLLTDRSVENICKLGRHLHYLHLGHASKITDASVRTLARSCTRLRYVDFANCTLLTDLSVFELAGLPKLRRIGLVRVSNLTDDAVFALAERHATLERIHLSYCDQINVMAIHFLLQKLHKLTHLSLTGVPAFRQPELQQFCRAAPADFNSAQQSAFCVFSGGGVSQLRAYLTEMFDRITEMNATDDTEYEDDDDIDEEDTPEPELVPQGDEEAEYISRAILFNNPHVTAYRLHRPQALAQPAQAGIPDRSSLISRLNARSPGSEISDRTIPPHLLASLNAVMASGSASAGSSNSHRQRQAPSATTFRNLTEALPVVENSQSPPPSDVASNASGATNRSNGAGFFRSYHEGGVPSRNSGVMTPELNFAEIGHGRGAVSGSDAINANGHQMRRGHANPPHHRSPFVQQESSSSIQSPPAVPAYDGETSSTGVTWPYSEPASPPLSDDNKSTVTELHASVRAALGGESGSGNGSEVRGRGVKKSLRNTLTAAEHNISTFFFGRSPPRGHDDNATGSSTSGVSNGATRGH